MESYIAVDIGGTHIRAGLYPSEGIEPIQIERIHTKGKTGTAYSRLIDLIQKIWPAKGKVRAIGVAAPGYIEPKQGVVISSPNIPEWKDFPLLQKISNHFSLPVLVGNDANLAAMGEWRFGSGRGFHHVLYLTISTGIGAGVIINDNLLLGSQGLAAELGHVTVLPDGPICSCGHRGHLEAIASGTAIANYVLEQIKSGRHSMVEDSKEISAYTISLAAQSGDALALEAIQRAAHFLGLGLAGFLHMFNPSIVILGGGVVNCGQLFLESMQKTLKDQVISEHYIKTLKITTSSLGDDAGLIGALALAHTIIL